MAQSGKIQSVTGLVTAKNIDGQMRELKIGDNVYENETIATSAGAAITIIQDDGNLISLPENTKAILDESVTTVIEPQDSVIPDVAGLQDALVEALEEGTDINEVLEDTAAGGVDETYDFRADYHSGDTARGEVGSYLLDGSGSAPGLPETNETPLVNDPNTEPVESENLAATSSSLTTSSSSPTPASSPSISSSESSSDSPTSVVNPDPHAAVPPDAVADEIGLDEDTPITINVLQNDSDADGTIDPTSVIITTQPQHGAVTVDPVTGEVTYTPDPNYNGADSFEYTVADNQGLVSTPANVNITVNPVNDAPIAVDDFNSTDEDTPLSSTLNLQANDTDIDGDTLSVDPNSVGTFTTDQGGTIVVAADGSYTYTPKENFNGNDSFDYTVTDGSLTDTGTLSITVNSVNNAPVAADDSNSTDEDTPVSSTLNLQANDTDIDGDTLSVDSNSVGTFTTDQGGTIVIDADGSYTYTPKENFNGNDSFDYTVTDGSLTDTGTLSITVNPVNDAPVSSAQPVTIDEDTSYTYSLSDFGFSDVDTGDSLEEIRVTSLPNASTGILYNGSTIVSANDVISATDIEGGNLTFEPTNNSDLDASWNYQISDGEAWSAETTSPITVTAVADAPTIDLDDTLDSIGTSSDAEIQIPSSQGLQLEFYDEANLDLELIKDTSQVESSLEAMTPTATSTVTEVNVTNHDESDGYRYSGLIYLEAGSSYTLEGYVDDTYRLEIGGTPVIQQGFNNWGNYEADTYTPTESGYYTLELIFYNGDAAGAHNINVSIDGGTAVPLNTANFNLYPDLNELDGLGAQHSPLIAINDGGYYPIHLNEGVEGSEIQLSDIGVSLADNDSSEYIASVIVSDIPENAILSDGTNTFTASAGNNSVDINNWDMDNISIVVDPNSTTAASTAFDLTITATSEENANSDTASTSSTLTVTVNEAGFSGGTAVNAGSEIAIENLHSDDPGIGGFTDGNGDVPDTNSALDMNPSAASYHMAPSAMMAPDDGFDFSALNEGSQQNMQPANDAGTESDTNGLTTNDVLEFTENSPIFPEVEPAQEPADDTRPETIADSTQPTTDTTPTGDSDASTANQQADAGTDTTNNETDSQISVVENNEPNLDSGPSEQANTDSTGGLFADDAGSAAHIETSGGVETILLIEPDDGDTIA